jgi:hypothetical protein
MLHWFFRALFAQPKRRSKPSDLETIIAYILVLVVLSFFG